MDSRAQGGRDSAGKTARCNKASPGTVQENPARPWSSQAMRAENRSCLGRTDEHDEVPSHDVSEKQRLADKIRMKIEDRKITNASNAAPRSYAVELHLTRYEKGNKVARFMLAGLGQIHIDGKVDLYQMPEHKLIGEFDLQKTFAWGGVYGASTSIEEIETTFADGVAAAVTGQSDDKAKQQKKS
jgi:hypothetical protein